LLQHEHIQSKLNDLNHKWRKTFGRPLFWILNMSIKRGFLFE
jgi:hypothetical protein